MRKLSLAILIGIFLLAGCAQFSNLFSVGKVDDDSLVKAKMLGKIIAQEKPEIAKGAGLVYATGLLNCAKEGKLTSDQLMAASDVLLKEIGKEKIKIYVDAFFLFVPAVEIKIGEPNAELILYLEALIEGMAGR